MEEGDKDLSASTLTQSSQLLKEDVAMDREESFSSNDNKDLVSSQTSCKLPVVVEKNQCEFQEEFQILELPQEIRQIIFNQMNWPDRLNARSGCKQLKREIDQSATFTVRIDDNLNKRYRNLLKLHVASCIVDNWTHFGTSSKSKLPFLSYPHRLKKIVFNGKIKRKMVAHFLTKCPQIEALICTHELLGTCPNVFKTKRIEQQLLNLHNLSTLELQLLRSPEEGYGASKKSNISVFLQATFPNLKSFKLDYSLCGEWTELFEFLIRHSTQLKFLNLHVGDVVDRTITQEYLNGFPRTRINGINQLLANLRLKEFTFHDNVLHLNPVAKDIIFDLLNRQQNCLETFNFHTSNGDLTFDIFSTVVRNNEQTINTININCLKNIVAADDDNFFELPYLCLDLFSDCKNLKNLTLSAYSKEENGIPAFYPEITTLSYLPQSLISLEINDYRFYDENYIVDILEFAKCCTKLESFILTSPRGCPPPESLKCSYLLKTIIENCNNLKYIHVNPVLYVKEKDDSKNSELTELVKLFEIYMGVRYDPNDDLDGFEFRF